MYCELLLVTNDKDKGPTDTFESVIYSLAKRKPKHGFCRMYVEGKMDYVFALEVDDTDIDIGDIKKDSLVYVFECKNKDFDPNKIVFKTDYEFKKTIYYKEFFDAFKKSKNFMEFFADIRKLLTH